MFSFSRELDSRSLCPNNYGRSYKNKRSTIRHLQLEFGTDRKFECYVCHKQFTRNYNMGGHLVTVHGILPNTENNNRHKVS